MNYPVNRRSRDFQTRNRYTHAEVEVRSIICFMSKSRETIHTHVVDVTQSNSNRTHRQRILRKGQKERTARLLRDRHHANDENAIAVVINQGQIGYLSVDVSAELAPLMEQGRYFEVTSLKIRKSRVEGEDEKIWTAEVKIQENEEAGIPQPELKARGSMVVAYLMFFWALSRLFFLPVTVLIKVVFINPVKAAAELFIFDDENTERIEQEISTQREQGGNEIGILMNSVKLIFYRCWLFLISLFALFVIMVVSCN